MTHEEAIKAIAEATDAFAAATIAFEAIQNFSDLEMLDGDAARLVAKLWLSKFVAHIAPDDDCA